MRMRWRAALTAAPPAAEPSARPVLVAGREPSQPALAAAGTSMIATPTVGALYLSDDDGYLHMCSASTVPSAGRNLILTAAHCLYDRETGTWHKNGVYMPYFRYGVDPVYGMWVLDRALISPDWQASGEKWYDLAFATVQPRADGARVEDVTGSNGLGFFPPTWYKATVFGYPSAPPYDGMLQMNCTDTIMLHIAECPFTRGASGGPWLRDYQNERRWGYVTGLSAAAYSDGSGLLSPDFGPAAYALYQTARTY